MKIIRSIKIKTKIILSIFILFAIMTMIKSFLITSNGIYAIILVLAIVLAFGFALSIYIAKDLKMIIEAAKKLMNGDLNVHLDIDSNDEFGMMAKVFNKMVQRIRARVNSSDVLIDVMKRVAVETTMEKTLMVILEGAQKITDSKYAALAIFDKNKKVEKFLQIGMSDTDVNRIGHYPEGKGLLGYIHETHAHLRLEEMRSHPRSVGFPANHPAMKSLVACPILFGNQSLGNLYVADKNSADKAFNEDDEHAMLTFAQIAANIIREKISSQEIIQSKEYLDKEVEKLLKTIDRLAAGDLTVNVEENEKDDIIGKLRDQLRLMIDNLRVLITQVKDAVEATASASAQISSSTEEMSSGAREQTMQSTEIASAVEEMTKTILETSKNTSMASSSAREAGEKAKDGGKVIVQTIEGMNKIADVVTRSAGTVVALGNSSNQIGEIIQVIEDIADQTNLLALNAAIEAARAGEQGRGFAVVADEVRKLAERTTKATKEIAEMIKHIQKDTSEAVESMTLGTKEVENGKQLANSAGTALDEIISATEKVSDIITQVAVAAEEQSKASDEISRNIEAITTVTEETSMGISQIANATGDLSRLTNTLQDLVTNFKVDESAKSTMMVRQNGKLTRMR
ncbi:MAG: methyl-accepting chemotaxis protein [Bacteroidota bacterium]|nr:methyl-accepting chemotaxis protein [Bacteroidota bacterium]MDP4194586.1 methyl-accepting chemotaxis protein [Bacteroidota bacterium]